MIDFRFKSNADGGPVADVQLRQSRAVKVGSNTSFHLDRMY